MTVFLKILCLALAATATACSRGGDDPGDTTAALPTVASGTVTAATDRVSIGEARRTRPRSRVTVTGFLFITYLPREATRLCTRVRFSGAVPACVRPAIPARTPPVPLEGLESTPNGLFIWSPRPMRFVGSFDGRVFRIERILP